MDDPTVIAVFTDGSYAYSQVLREKAAEFLGYTVNVGESEIMYKYLIIWVNMYKSFERLMTLQ